MEIIIAKDYDSMSEKAAKVISDHIHKKRTFVLGLATGSTPLGLYGELVRRYRKGELDFSSIVTFNLDEYYGIDREHCQSYSYFMHENLFKHININPGNVHIPNGKISQEDVQSHCKEYENKIRKHGGIDIQVLGIGVDGHIGFNEPGSAKDSRTKLIALDQSTIDVNWEKFYKNTCKNKDKMPRYALTMGIATILEAKKILLLASGKEKAEIIARLINEDISATLPASFLKLHIDVTIFLDREAASQLNPELKLDNQRK
jgi:glucosamine-6-phosphate deaminase